MKGKRGGFSLVWQRNEIQRNFLPFEAPLNPDQMRDFLPDALLRPKLKGVVTRSTHFALIYQFQTIFSGSF